MQYYKLNVPNHEAELEVMCKERGYTYHDFVTISPTTLPNYEEKITHFFTEHLHKDEEIRLCLEVRFVGTLCFSHITHRARVAVISTSAPRTTSGSAFIALPAISVQAPFHLCSLLPFDKACAVILPAGIYHRFKNDEGNYSRFMRLFQGEPVWTPYNRGPDADQFPERARYLDSLAQA